MIKFINFNISFIKTNIQPCFKSGGRTLPIADVTSRTVDRLELTHLWSSDKKRAIAVIKNNGQEKKSIKCNINLEVVQTHFKNSSSRSLTESVNITPWGDAALPPPPPYIPEPAPITAEEVSNAIKKLPAKKSPGADGVTYDTLKANTRKLTPALTAIFNVCMTHCRVPSDWKTGIISLLPKTQTPSQDITEWRPISLLLTSYKLFMSIIQKRIMPWICDTGRLSQRQKGSLPRNGLQEHVFCLKSAVTDFLHQSSKLFVTFIDLKDAFGSIDHEFMISCLQAASYPPYVIQITRDVYTNSTFIVKTAEGFSQPINRHKGIVQGDPWSLICFEQGIDPWLRWIDANSSASKIPAPIQGYVDDVSLCAKHEQELHEMANKTELFVNTTGMQVKNRKCAILNGQRTGNNWARNSNTSNINVEIQSDKVPVYDRDQSYKYLGVYIRIDNKSNQSSELITECLELLKQIDISFLPNFAKIEAINVICLSKLNFYFPNLIFSEKELATLEDEVVSYVRHWLGLNKSSTRSYFFTAKSKGGLGLINPRVSYYAKHLQFHLAVLNSDDPAVRQAARSSLDLHMSKRKAVPTTSSEDSFAGYVTAGNKIVKNSKVNWSKSNWVNLFELCHRENVHLIYNSSDNLYRYVLNVDEDISFQIPYPKQFYDRFKEFKLAQFESIWKSLPSQGRVAREISSCVDSRLSATFMANHKLSDELRSFVCRGRLQLLQCNSLLHLYYNTPKHCYVCSFPSDTASHILNTCPHFKNMYQKRHNRIVDLIFNYIIVLPSFKCQHIQILKDCLIKPCMFGSLNEHFTHPYTRPDIVIIDKELNHVILVEISVPFDAHLDKCYKEKFNKYFPLSMELDQMGYRVTIVVLILGSLGNVHNKFVSGLKMIGMKQSNAKYLTKYCSISAIIGSYQIWQQRCKEINFN